MSNYNHPDNERRAGSHFPEWMGDIPLSGMSWLRSLDEELSRNIRAGMPICLIAIHHGRSCGAIVGRLKQNEPRFKTYWDSRYTAHGTKKGDVFRADLSFIFRPVPGSIEERWHAQRPQRETLEEWQAKYRKAAERREYLADDTVEIKIEGQEILDLLAVQKAKLVIDQANANELQKDWVKEQLKAHFAQTKKSILFLVGITVALNALLAAVITTSL